MGSRTELHAVLEDVLGSEDVYFQPPPSTEIRYPCIIYSKSREEIRFASNVIHTHARGYTVTVIHRNPDSIIPDKMLALQYCGFDTQYKSDNLYHDVYSLYY